MQSNTVIIMILLFKQKTGYITVFNCKS